MMIKKILLISAVMIFTGCAPVSKVNKYEQMITGTNLIHCFGGGCGSGFFIDPNHIVTAGHVGMLGVDKIILSDGTEIKPIEVILHDEQDISIIVVNEVNGVYLFPISNSELNIGDDVVAIGNPTGLINFVSFGKISNTVFQHQGIKGEAPDFFVGDIASGPGSSGCVVVNNKGEAIGVLVAGPPEHFIMPVSYILPIKYVKDLLK